MRVMLIGAQGQLGTDLVRAMLRAEVTPLTHADVEVENADSVKTACRQYRPDVIINTAAFVRVDDCEAQIDTAYGVNAIGAGNVAVCAQESGAKLIHISTDYVFGGGDQIPALPFTEFDKPAPVNVYGASKLAGEDYVRHLCHRHFIVRTSGLFGVAGSSGKGGNFIETMLRLAHERDEIRVVRDQVFSPTSTHDLAGMINEMMVTEHYGVFHVTNSGACSWYEFTEEILRLAGLVTSLVAIESAQFPQPARRPHFSVLDNYRLRLLGLPALQSWQDALGAYMEARVKRQWERKLK